MINILIYLDYDYFFVHSFLLQLHWHTLGFRYSNNYFGTFIIGDQYNLVKNGPTDTFLREQKLPIENITFLNIFKNRYPVPY